MSEQDVARRYECFKDKFGKDGWVEEEPSFLIHALFLLTELNTTENLDKVLQLLREDKELLEFRFGDYLTEEIWRTIYQLGNNQLEMLWQK